MFTYMYNTTHICTTTWVLWAPIWVLYILYVQPHGYYGHSYGYYTMYAMGTWLPIETSSRPGMSRAKHMTHKKRNLNGRTKEFKAHEAEKFAPRATKQREKPASLSGPPASLSEGEKQQRSHGVIRAKNE